MARVDSQPCGRCLSGPPWSSVVSVLKIGHRHRSAAWWWALAGVCVALVAPLAVIDVPPLGDYPNHLARIFVLSRLPGDAELGRFYAPHWAVLPNLAVDLIGLPLVRILPVHLAGRILIALSVLLPVLGAVAYSGAARQVASAEEPHHRERDWWVLGVGLVAYHLCELEGFLNFSISVGLAMMLAAAWLWWREARPGLAVGLAFVGAPALFVCHLMGLVFFGFLAGGAELHRIGREHFIASVLRRGAVLAAVFAVPFALYAMSDLRQLGGDAAFLAPMAKLAELLSPFVNYSWPLDVGTAVLVVGLAVWAGSLTGPAAWSFGLLLVVFLAAPYAWKGTYGLDTRVAIMLGFLLFAGVRTQARWAGILLLAVFVVRMGVLTVAWAEYRHEVADVRAALAPVHPGQTVYVAEAGLAEAPGYHFPELSTGVRSDEHLGALALIERRAWWPFEFDNASQQPIRTLEPYAAMAERVGNLPDRATAAVANVCGFDYVLLTGADAVSDLPARRFRLLVGSGYAALYAITQCKEEP